MAASRKKTTRSTIGKNSSNRKRPGAEYEKKYFSTHGRYPKSSAKEGNNFMEEPLASYTTRIRPIGNSKGVILNNQLIEAAGINSGADIIIHAGAGVIYIIEAKAVGVNTDLSTWDKQYKIAIKNGAKPEGDMFEGTDNEFDETEW
jgi:antitoxin MazE